MEVSMNLLWEFTPGMLLTATFCYGSTAALRQVKPLNEHKIFKALLPIIPGFFGGLLAVLVPFFWPPMATVPARAVLGAVAGFNMGTLYDLMKRLTGVYTNKLVAKVEQAALPGVSDAANPAPSGEPEPSGEPAGEVVPPEPEPHKPT